MARREEFSVGKLWVRDIVGPGSPGSLITAGKKLYVDSNQGAGSRQYMDPTYPTLPGALAQCLSGRGDIIYVLAGHAETLTASTIISTTGVKIIGCGQGDNRPTFTVNSAITGFNVRADDVLIHNLRFKTGASLLTATLALARLMKIGKPSASISDVTISGCQFDLSSIMRHAVVVGNSTGTGCDDIKFVNCVFENEIVLNATAGLVHPKTALLIRGGSGVAVDCIVEDCRFIDMEAWAAEGWDNCIVAGGIGDVLVKNCVFTCRGVAVKGRSAGVSPQLSIVGSQGISTSANTAVANIFQVTYANIVDSYAIGAVNVRAKMVPAATEA